MWRNGGLLGRQGGANIARRRHEKGWFTTLPGPSCCLPQLPGSPSPLGSSGRPSPNIALPQAVLNRVITPYLLRTSVLSAANVFYLCIYIKIHRSMNTNVYTQKEFKLKSTFIPEHKRIQTMKKIVQILKELNNRLLQ